jgi:hypothetical protein
MVDGKTTNGWRCAGRATPQQSLVLALSLRPENSIGEQDGGLAACPRWVGGSLVRSAVAHKSMLDTKRLQLRKAATAWFDRGGVQKMSEVSRALKTWRNRIRPGILRPHICCSEAELSNRFDKFLWYIISVGW